MSGVPSEMRVGLLSRAADLYSSGQRNLRDLALSLHESRFEPLVIVPAPGPLSEALARAGVDCVTVPLPALRGGTGTRGVRSLRRLLAALRDRRCAVLHSDSPRTAFYAGLAARLGGPPHLWHLRASLPSSALSDRVLLSLSDAIIAESRTAARRSPALRRSRKVRVIHTGLPPIEFLERGAARAVLGLPSDGIIAGVIGRVERNLGGDDAVRALPAMRAAAPGALLAFLGHLDHDARWPHTLRLRAAAAGLRGAVQLLGDHEDAARLLKAFDLVLYPSCREALPRVLIEAMFAGVPVAAAAVGGVIEVVDPEVSGLLADPRDPGALAAAAARLAGDAALRRRLGKGGLARARARFDVRSMVASITAVYDELLGRVRPLDTTRRVAG